MNVVKANGDIVPYDENKIRWSLKRVKTKPILIEQVIEKVRDKIFDGMTTSELFKIVFGELKKRQRKIAGKYNLKRAIMDLGPSGFPFEKFIAAIWKTYGFNVEVGNVIKGKCINHEVDVVAKRGDENEFIECKHHSIGGKYCDVKTALYVSARFLDLEQKIISVDAQNIQRFKGWLVTNTRFSTDAIKYGSCAGLGLLSWDHPLQDGLRERIDRSGLHPITCLTLISRGEKKRLMNKGITLCRDLVNEFEVLPKIGFNNEKAKEILAEASAICGKVEEL